jgi:AraC-like DNA-binding protein
MGPFTRSRILSVGWVVRAIGAVLPATLSSDVFGVPASELVDQIVPLEALWSRDEVERFEASLSGLPLRRGVAVLQHALVSRIGRAPSQSVEHTAAGIITARRGRVSVDEIANSCGMSRQQFARRFRSASGLSPKRFARVIRFQNLVHTLLSNEVSRWASLAHASGFYDQAHMINEFRTFAGAPPTIFFRPHDHAIDPARIHLRGRPSEWLRW